MLMLRKIFELALKPPHNISDLNFVMLYFIVAIFPSFLVQCFSSLIVNIDEINYQAYLPEIGRSLTAVFLAPWIETLIFFAPTGWFLTSLEGGKRWCKLIVAAFIFTSYHFFWGDRTFILAPFIFWSGLVMAYAFETSSKTGRKSVKLITCIHILINGVFLLYLYAGYGLTKIATSFATKISILILLQLSFVLFCYWCITKISASYHTDSKESFEKKPSID